VPDTIAPIRASKELSTAAVQASAAGAKRAGVGTNVAFEVRKPVRRAANGQGNWDGGTRFFVACSNAYASSISRGSLHPMPVKLTP